MAAAGRAGGAVVPEGKMLKIYGQYRSRAFRVVWLCKESRIPFEHVDVTTKGNPPGCKEESYRRLNPNARVPTIDDGGFVLWESAAINVYLAKKYESPLYPRTFEGEGRMLQWGFFIANDVEPPMTSMHENRTVLPLDMRNPALADESERRLLGKLSVLESQLGRTAYFGGKQWDMADFMVASVLYTLYSGKHDLSGFPKLGTWLEESVQRPAAREARSLRE